MSGDNSLWVGSGYPSSCAYDFGTAGQLIELAASYITFDNFENTGVCYSGAADLAFIDQAQGGAGFHHTIISNNYIHGWKMPSSASGYYSFWQSLGSLSGGEQTNVFVGNVVDGSDSPHFATGSNCTYSADPCASGQALYGWAWDVHGNVFRYLMDVAVTLNTSLWHDNLTEYLYTAWSTAAVNNQHSNIMNNLGGATGESMYFYNNIIRNTYVTEDMYFGVRTNLYFFNNVMYNNMNNSTFGGIGAGGCLRLNSVSNSASTQTAYIYNNTTDYSCLFKFEVTNGPLKPWNGIGNFENNHFINFSPATISSVYDCNTGGTCTINDIGHEIYQTFTVANGQGYVTGNNYAPTLVTNSTVGAGGNLTSSCSTFSFDGALCNGTSGTYEASGSGGMIAVTPGITLNARPSSGPWDSGGYQFVSGGGSPGVGFSPTSLSFGNQLVPTTSSPQTITLTNTGTTTLSIASISFTGTNFSDFSQINTCGSSLSAGLNCTITVRFTPAASGSRTASLSVADNAAGSPQTAVVSGTGILGNIPAAVKKALLLF
jgi:hypothetical protein